MEEPARTVHNGGAQAVAVREMQAQAWAGGLDPPSLGTETHPDAVGLHGLPQHLGDVGILSFGELAAMLQDNDLSSQTGERLRHLDRNRAASTYEQAARPRIEVDPALRIDRLNPGEPFQRRVGGARAGIEQHTFRQYQVFSGLDAHQIPFASG